MPLLADGRTGVIPLNHNTPLRFSHTSINKPLIINTGANSIQWSYALNTNVVATYGGEVGQILSAFVDSITISGTTRNNDQLKEIYEWFLQYMQLAGLHNREEEAIKFEYPERGWVFYIQVRDAPNFEYNVKKIAMPWQITAEVVADNDLNYLSGYTMSVVGESVTFDPSLYDVGFNVEQPNFQPSFGATLADNFQALLGAWATGDFHHWGFDVLKPANANDLNPDAAAIFRQAFGSDFITGKPAAATGGPGGASAYTGPQNPKTTSDILQDIYFSAQSTGVIPGVLAVTIALIETGNPSATDPGISPDSPGVPRSSTAYVGLFQTNDSGRGHSGTHATELRAVATHTNEPVTKYYPSGMQIEDFTRWAVQSAKPSGASQHSTDGHVLQQWAISIQGITAGSNNPRYQDYNEFAGFLQAARKITSGFSASGSVAGYRDPLRAVGNLGLGRIDEGVDYTGDGPIYAVGPGRISFAGTNTGWPGGTYISYTLTVGGAQGKTIYIAENITPTRSWRPGDLVDSNTVLGHMHNSYPYIETGWSQPGNDLPMAYTIYQKVPDGTPTAFGVNFAKFMKAIGGTSINPSSPGAGTLPSGWPTW